MSYGRSREATIAPFLVLAVLFVVLAALVALGVGAVKKALD